MHVRSGILMFVVAAAGLAAAACNDDESATMRPGDDCLACHTPSGTGSAMPFGAGGTVYYRTSAPAAAVLVTLTDSAAVEATAVTNSVGNFYFPATLMPPLLVRIDDGTAVSAMPGATGDCNACHSTGGAAGGPLLLQ
jgi:hypothetical protein